MRRDHAVAWELQHARPYLAAATGRNPIDEVWVQAFESERDVHGELHTVSTLWDLNKFFEWIDHDVLLRRALDQGFPEATIRLAIAGYSMSRVVTVRRRLSVALAPARGVVPGCGLATTCIAIYSVPVFDGLLADVNLYISAMRLTIFVDDMHLRATSASRSQVSLDAVQGSRELARAVTEGLGCKLALQKGGVVASDNRLAARVAKHLHGLPNSVEATIVNLGIDFFAGKKLRVARAGTRAARMAKVAARRRRLSRVKSAVGGAVVRLYRAGIHPQAAFGTEVTGLSDVQLQGLRTELGRGLTPSAQGRSLDAVCLVKGDLAAASAVAPLAQWSRMVWTATTEPMHPAVKLSDLSAGWAAMARQPPARWADARGPAGVAWLTLRRLGWTASSAFVWRDDLGAKVILTKSSPKDVKLRLLAGHRRWLERRVAAKLGYAQPADRGFLGHISALNASRAAGLTAAQKAAMTSVACGAVWTLSRRRLQGYDTDGRCVHGCDAQDTVYHRIVECPAYQPQRASHFDERLLAWAIEQGPGHITERLIPVITLEGIDMPSDDMLTSVAKGVFDLDSDRLDSEIYMDGSFLPHVVPELGRSAWALVALDERGEHTITICGTVPATMVQSAPAAEHAAYCAWMELRRPDSAYPAYTDCQVVLDGHTLPPKLQLSARRRHAGAAREALAYRPPGGPPEPLGADHGQKGL